MSRIDVKTWPDYRAKQGRFDVVDLPTRSYLMIDGHGDPNTEPFAEAIETLYPAAYTAKFAAKRELGVDCVVPPAGGAVVGRGHGRLHHGPGQVTVGLDPHAPHSRRVAN